MINYELVFIVRPDIEDTALETLINKLQQFVVTVGGKVAQFDRLGRRRLAYPIRRFREGVYLVGQVEMEPTKVPELDRSLRLGEEIIRYSIVRKGK